MFKSILPLNTAQRGLCITYYQVKLDNMLYKVFWGNFKVLKKKYCTKFLVKVCAIFSSKTIAIQCA